MDSISAPKGQPTEVVSLVASTAPCSFHFQARTVSGEEATGKVEVFVRRLFRTRRLEFPLEAHNKFEKRGLCASYRIVVTPDEDALLYHETTHIRAGHIYIVLGILAALIAAAAAVPYVLEFFKAL